MGAHITRAYGPSVTEFTLAYNPTHNFLPDMSEVGRDKLGITSQVAREFSDVLKDVQARRSQPAPQVNGPTGIRRQIVGNEEWVAYKRQDGETQIYTRPLDSAHFIEVVISYISNSKNESWRGRASSDAEKILRSISIIRRRSTG
jgi:hypothetical protein